MNVFSKTYNTNVTWSLSVFLKIDDDLVSQIDIPIVNDEEVRVLLGYNENDSLVGEHPLNRESAERIEQKYEVHCDVEMYDIFLGASKPA